MCQSFLCLRQVSLHNQKSCFISSRSRKQQTAVKTDKFNLNLQYCMLGISAYFCKSCGGIKYLSLPDPFLWGFQDSEQFSHPAF